MELVANIQGQTFTWSFSGFGFIGANMFQPLVFSGPAAIQLLALPNVNGSYGFATFDVEPGPYRPDKAVTIGAYSGNVKVTMETSTDLVNWTTAVNGQIYTNSPIAQFFRITLVKNAAP